MTEQNFQSLREEKSKLWVCIFSSRSLCCSGYNGASNSLYFSIWLSQLYASALNSGNSSCSHCSGSPLAQCGFVDRQFRKGTDICLGLILSWESPLSPFRGSLQCIRWVWLVSFAHLESPPVLAQLWIASASLQHICDLVGALSLGQGKLRTMGPREKELKVSIPSSLDSF